MKIREIKLMGRKESRVKKTLSEQMIQKLAWHILLFLAVTGVFAVLLYYWLRSKIWYSDDPGYALLHSMHENPWICATLFFVWMALGIGFISYRMIDRMIHYVDDITEGVNHIYQDTEERLRMPSELLVVQEQLNEIQEKARQNRLAARDAEQRKMDLIIYLAHDLKTPLTSVIGYLSILTDERELSDNLRERYLGIALKKAERLEELINEFFDITRFNLSEIVLELSRVNVTRMLEQMAYEFRPMYREKNLTYRLSLQENMEMSLDVDKMSRVFDNLFKNVFYYSYTDSELLISLGEYKDWESLFEDTKPSGNWKYYISFKNRGKTIPRAKTEQIFEQFFRMESARSSQTGGAGLGLAIAREIVRKHGGEMICESREEMIVFTIFLGLEAE